MFGYVRAEPAEMKLRDYTYYRAVYCGVCREMGKQAGALFPLSLRYDFVFLALMRLLLSNEKGKLVQKRCAAHPLKKRLILTETKALADTARLSAVLAHYSIDDTVRDERGAKRMAARVISPVTSRYRNKAVGRGDEHDAEMATLDAFAKEKMASLATLEAVGEISPDAAAAPFAELLSEIFAYGYRDGDARIARACGMAVGRFVYLCDAVDDAIKDEKTKSYNPFVCAAQKEGSSVTDHLAKHKASIEATLTLAAKDAYYALLLASNAEAHPAWPSLENLLIYGMPEMAHRVAEHPGKALDRRDIGAHDIYLAEHETNDRTEDNKA